MEIFLLCGVVIFFLFFFYFVLVVLTSLGNWSSVKVYDFFPRHKNCIKKSTYFCLQSSPVWTIWSYEEKRGYGIKFNRTETNTENSINSTFLIGCKLGTKKREGVTCLILSPFFFSYCKTEKIHKFQIFYKELFFFSKKKEISNTQDILPNTLKSLYVKVFYYR